MNCRAIFTVIMLLQSIGGQASAEDPTAHSVLSDLFDDYAEAKGAVAGCSGRTSTSFREAYALVLVVSETGYAESGNEALRQPSYRAAIAKRAEVIFLQSLINARSTCGQNYQLDAAKERADRTLALLLSTASALSQYEVR